MTGFRLQRVYGTRPAALSPPFPKPLSDASLTLTSPVGLAQDRRDNVWVADTGTGRLIVFDTALSRVLARIDPDPAFDLPFRLAHHPTDRAVFVTDVADGCVRRLEYAYDGEAPTVTAADVLRPDEGPFHPNGVATARYRDGVRVFVADEFYHDGSTSDAGRDATHSSATTDADRRSRIVVFDDAGRQRDQFRTVRRDETEIPIYWPQGLATDVEGRLYVANTGYGVLAEEFGMPAQLSTVLRCDRSGAAEPFPGNAGPTLDEFPLPRDVCVVDDTVFVPDAAEGVLHAYTKAGVTQGATVPVVRGTGESRFGGPVGVHPYRGRSGTDADGEGTPLLLTEGLGGTVAAYAVADGRADRLAAVGATGDREGQLAFATGSAAVSDTGTDTAPFSASTAVWIADSLNRRLQYAPLGTDDGLAAVDLPGTAFPFGLAWWDTPGAGGRLLVTDYSADFADHPDRPQVRVYALDGHVDEDPRLVESFGSWGLGSGELKLPRGVAVDPLGGRNARVYVADSGNGRVGVWEYDAATETATDEGDIGTFGHAGGNLWNPSDVAVGDRGLYVADENNNRIQRYADGEWTALGGAGYDPGAEFLLPVSLDFHDGHLFVVDLVDRAVEAFAETADGLSYRDRLQRFGGDATAGEFWLPYLLTATDGAATDGIDLVVPDASLNAAHHYTWKPE